VTLLVLALLSLCGCGGADQKVPSEQEETTVLHTCQYCENAQAWGDDTAEVNMNGEEVCLPATKGVQPFMSEQVLPSICPAVRLLKVKNLLLRCAFLELSM